MRDPYGVNLDRIQIVKGWVGEGGQVEQAVYDVAGEASPARVDLRTCQPDPRGADSLCSVWSDPDFDPELRAVYYARVVENPSCRWSTWDAVRAGVPPRPDLKSTLQERVWSSPIWYVPTEN